MRASFLVCASSASSLRPETVEVSAGRVGEVVFMT